ncbi:MAG: hypothetical protein V1773_11290 [bacterium]
MKKYLLTILIILLALSTKSNAQSSDLQIFGYFQGYYNYFSDFSVNLPMNPMLNSGKPVKQFSTNAKSSFLSQQLNLFFKKDFSGELGEFTTFVNLELTSNYSSDNLWGAFNLEEAWLKYNSSDAFNVKFGTLIPTFNNLNEIKNRTPLLPYMFRPLVYETYVADIIALEDFIPEQAFMQVYGKLNLSENLDFHYSAFIGNAEKSYVAQKTSGIVLPGQDTSKFKTVGGRIGLKYNTIKMGISGTFDRDNQNKIFNQSILNKPNYSGTYLAPLSGDLPRIRLGADLSFSVADFVFESEFIAVKYNISDDQKKYLSTYREDIQTALVNTVGAINQISTQIKTNPADPANSVRLLQLSQLAPFAQSLSESVAETAELGTETNKLFYYFMIGYNVNDKLQVYGMYNYLQDKFDVKTASKLELYVLGMNWSPIPSVSIKGQYTHQKIADLGYDVDALMFGFSVYF